MTKKAESGDLRALLASKLKVKERRIYQLAQQLANRASITTAEAIWIIAAQNGINLTKYLPPEVVEKVRVLRQQLPAPPRPLAVPPSPSQRRSVQARGSTREFVIAREFRGTDPILPAKILLEAREMAATYPLLYVLENSMREFIRRVIEARHGTDWWHQKAPRKIREKIKDRMSDDSRNPWHQRRGGHPIDYLDLNQLPALVRATQADFVPDFLSSLEWFNQFVEEVYRSRCVVCHMNPLHKDNIQAVKVRFRQWQKLVSEKQSDLP